jgi:hypothetical protein
MKEMFDLFLQSGASSKKSSKSLLELKYASNKKVTLFGEKVR